MEAMILNDREKEWMTPLLEFRNMLAPLNANGVLDDWNRRDFRRMTGKVKMDRKGRLIHGPYTKEWRERWLRRVLEVECEVRGAAPADMGDLRLISDDELREIRRIWIEEKHEFDDSLPVIYKSVTGLDFPFLNDLQTGPFGPTEWNLLKELVPDQGIFFNLQASLLNAEQRSVGLSLRKARLDELEDLIEQAWYPDEAAATTDLARKVARRGALEQAEPAEEDAFDTEEGLDTE